MIYMFLSNNPSSGDINSSNLPCFIQDVGRKLAVDKKQVHGVCQTSQSLLKDLVAAVVMKVMSLKALSPASLHCGP